MFGENFKEENCLWRRVLAQECSPSQIFYLFLEFLQTYFLPTLAGCFWCFLLVYKLNMIGHYPNERVCLEQNKFYNKSGPAFGNPIQQIE